MNKDLYPARTFGETDDRLGFAVLLQLDDERTFRVVGWLGSNMFHPAVPVYAKEIESQTVFVGLDFSDELGPEDDPLRLIYHALED